MLYFVIRQNNTRRIDTQIAKQVTDEINDCKATLAHIIIKCLSTKVLSLKYPVMSI